MTKREAVGVICFEGNIFVPFTNNIPFIIYSLFMLWKKRLFIYIYIDLTLFYIFAFINMA